MKPFDDVAGQIIGGDYGQCWVTYEGRKQGKTMYADNYPDADVLCMGVVNRLQDDLGDNFYIVYPNKNGWKFHFDGI